MTIPLMTGLALGLAGAILLLVKSAYAFSRTGPQIREDVWRDFRGHSAMALLRLVLWAWLIIAWMAWIGCLPYVSLQIMGGEAPGWKGVFVSALAGIVMISALQFCHQLLHIPSSIMMSSNYKMSRFYPLASMLTVSRLRWLRILLIAMASLPVLAALRFTFGQGDVSAFMQLQLFSGCLLAPYLYASWPALVRPVRAGAQHKSPNILMIGCDTLRVDRFGACGYARNLTPMLDALIKRGTAFMSCYTPLARTAPSLASLLTGTWPRSHGVTTNFISDAQARLPSPSLAQLLAAKGYQTAAISDWSGSDLGKISFGFQHVEAPRDQWNLKYLIRQGPKDIRLFLSLFTHNRFGRRFLPELYYLAGVPLTTDLGRQAKRWINRFAAGDKPFLLNAFMATSHPPFGSEYPYYQMYSEPAYGGESRFAMARLSDPFDVIRSQREPREAFDLDQINDLYDACVRRFDDEVRNIIHHLRDCGLLDNTIIVVYSDHGMEMFEHDTWGQGNSAVGEASPRVPLLIVDPRRKAGGGVDPRVVRTVDLLPTLLDLCGIDIPKHVDGESLLPYMDSADVDDERPAFFETGVWLATPPGQNPDHLSYPELFTLLEADPRTGTLAIKEEFRQTVDEARDRMVRKGRWKLVRFPLKQGVVYHLFDLRADPGCKCDVLEANPEVVEELRQFFAGWVA